MFGPAAMADSLTGISPIVEGQSKSLLHKSHSRVASGLGQQFGHKRAMFFQALEVKGLVISHPVLPYAPEHF
jgi:hypothetical protein